jgi:hypothetical protein
MAFSTDSDLTAVMPDATQLGIGSFTDEHPKARADIERDLRIHWWSKKGLSGEMDASLLTESQWTLSAVYLVLWKYALPQLSTWGAGDRFVDMIDFYKGRYGEEFEAVLRDGVEYDADDDSTVTNAEKIPVHSGRLAR